LFPRSRRRKTVESPALHLGSQSPRHNHALASAPTLQPRFGKRGYFRLPLPSPHLASARHTNLIFFCKIRGFVRLDTVNDVDITRKSSDYILSHAPSPLRPAEFASPGKANRPNVPQNLNRFDSTRGRNHTSQET